jgi:alanine dehydrogenase
MRVGVPKETKSHEYRVGLTPASVQELASAGHEVFVEAGAGSGAGFPDEEYVRAGAAVIESASEVFAVSDMIVKVKEPSSKERSMLKPDQILFTYLHLAPDQIQTSELIASGAVCIAYETVTSQSGALPLLAPMSEVAGRLAPQVGATALQKEQGGRGVLLGGVPGVSPAKVVILGGGVAGSHAATIAVGMGADVTVLDRSSDVLKRLEARFEGRLKTLHATRSVVEDEVRRSDLVIGAVLVPGATAPRLVTRALLAAMPKGSVLVDIAIDQGGCFETSRPTTHDDPTYVLDGVVHYCVANMPGAVPRTSTLALNNATLPFVLALSGKGWKRACLEDRHLMTGLNVVRNQVTCEPVAHAQDLKFVPPERLVA